MRRSQGLFGWQATRLLFAVGAFAVMSGILRGAVAASWSYLWLILAGVAMLALSTRGPWDSEESGRNRSVLGFHARSDPKTPENQRHTQP